MMSEMMLRIGIVDIRRLLRIRVHVVIIIELLLN